MHHKLRKLLAGGVSARKSMFILCFADTTGGVGKPVPNRAKSAGLKLHQTVSQAMSLIFNTCITNRNK